MKISGINLCDYTWYFATYFSFYQNETKLVQNFAHANNANWLFRATEASKSSSTHYPLRRGEQGVGAEEEGEEAGWTEAPPPPMVLWKFLVQTNRVTDGAACGEHQTRFIFCHFCEFVVWYFSMSTKKLNSYLAFSIWSCLFRIKCSLL